MNLLSFDNVRFAYRNSPILALNGVTLDIPEGAFVGVVGPTGAGKSTLIRAASGVVPKLFKGPFAGTVAFRGASIASQCVADLAGKIGAVFQDFESQLFSTHARIECAFGMENLGIDRVTMLRRIEQTAEKVGIQDLLDREPQSLSGGQKQRLALASVLCLQPEALLCDEVTTDLDPEARDALFDTLRQLIRARQSVVMVEHETERLLQADWLAVMRQGQIVAQGMPATLLSDPAFCAQHGLFTPPLFDLCAQLKLPDRPLTLEQAEQTLKQRGFMPITGTFPETPALAAAPLIEVADLRFAYQPAAPVLKGISLAIRRGEFIAILGRNGSGKTTLVKHLNALLVPQAGQVLYDGTPVAALGVSRMARKVGFVFQNPDHMLFAATIHDEVAFGLRNLHMKESALPATINRVLSTVGLAGREMIDPFIMTKGDRQKLAVACVLACEPDVLILDEPTTGLDAREQAAMMELLKTLNRAGHTIIIVTHAVPVAAAYAKRVVLMEEGRILADGPTRRIFHDPLRLAQAHITAPPCVLLGSRLGIPALTVAELTSALRSKGECV